MQAAKDIRAHLQLHPWPISLILFCALSNFWSAIHFSNAPQAANVLPAQFQVALPSLTASIAFLALIVGYRLNPAGLSAAHQRKALIVTSTLGGIIWFLEMIFSSSIGLVIAGYILFGLFYGYAIQSLVFRICKMNLLEMLAYFVVGTALGSVLGICANILRSDHAVLILHLLTPAVMACLMAAYDMRHSFNDQQRDLPVSQPLSKSLVVTFLLAGFIVGLHFNLAFDPSNHLQRQYATVNSLAVTVGMLLILLFTALKTVSLDFMLYRVGFPLMALGVVLMLVSSSSFAAWELSSGIFLTGSQLVVMLAWIICAYFAKNREVPLRRICPWIFFGIFLGRSIGIETGSLLAPLPLADEPIIGTRILQLIALYVVAIAFSQTRPTVSNRQAAEKTWRTATISVDGNEEGSRLEKIAELLKENSGLTAREFDVLLLLARGRTKRHIAEALGISENTVKKHIAKIYEKVGVHSQQELLDVLETCGEALGDNPSVCAP